MNEIWTQILEDYKTACHALWNPEHHNNWSRDETKGYYHMWKAYYTALNAEEKEPLVFARILVMMGDKMYHKQEDYTRLHKYYLPAKEQYELAIKAGLKPSDKELEHMNLYTDMLIYQFECENKNYYEHLSYIEGYEKLTDFGFHDSKVIFFSHDKTNAIMKLKYNSEKILELHFEDIYDIEIHTDPFCDWINEFYCYPLFSDKNRLRFDIGFYRIVCTKIFVAKYN